MTGLHCYRAAALRLTLILVALAAPTAQADVLRLSEPVEATATSETFGAPIPAQGEVYRLGTVLSNPAAHLERDLKIRTRVAKVCQKKGCFFIAQEGARTVRVSFRDYSFFIPTDSGDKTVLLAGRLLEKHRSAAEAQHLRDDLQRNPADGTRIPEGAVYELEAFAVQIPRSEPQG
ncbi:MAG: DUF4920 domain-containing protein [Pseudomonadota bacterium]